MAAAQPNPAAPAAADGRISRRVQSNAARCTGWSGAGNSERSSISKQSIACSASISRRMNVSEVTGKRDTK